MCAERASNDSSQLMYTWRVLFSLAVSSERRSFLEHISTFQSESRSRISHTHRPQCTESPAAARSRLVVLEWFGHLHHVRLESFRCSPSPAQRRHHPRRLRRRRGMPPPNRHGAEPSVHACNASRRRIDRVDRHASPPRCAVDVVEKSLERGASMLHGPTDVSDTSRLLTAALSDIH